MSIRRPPHPPSLPHDILTLGRWSCRRASRFLGSVRSRPKDAALAAARETVFCLYATMAALGVVLLVLNILVGGDQ